MEDLSSTNHPWYGGCLPNQEETLTGKKTVKNTPNGVLLVCELSLIGHQTVKLGRISGTRQPPWAFLQILRPLLALKWALESSLGAFYRKYEGQTGSYTRYKNKAVVMGLLLVMTAAFNGYRKAPYALYQAYDGQTRPYIRCKTATMESVLTTIIGLIMGIIKTPGPYFGHRTVKLGLISDTRQPSWTLHQLWWPSPTLYSGLWKSFGPLYRA